MGPAPPCESPYRVRGSGAATRRCRVGASVRATTCLAFLRPCLVFWGEEEEEGEEGCGRGRVLNLSAAPTLMKLWAHPRMHYLCTRLARSNRSRAGRSVGDPNDDLDGQKHSSLL